MEIEKRTLILSETKSKEIKFKELTFLSNLPTYIYHKNPKKNIHDLLSHSIIFLILHLIINQKDHKVQKN